MEIVVVVVLLGLAVVMLVGVPLLIGLLAVGIVRWNLAHPRKPQPLRIRFRHREW